MDLGLVRAEARCRRAESLLHPGKSAWRPRGRQLRPEPAEHPDPAQGAEGRLASVRAELLPPLPAGRAPCRTRRHVHQPCRFPMHRPRGEGAMNNKDHGNKAGADTERKGVATDRRKILLGGTALVAASALNAAAPIRSARAQQPAPAGRRPNILVIFGDDIGQTNLSAYSFGLMGYRTPNIDRIAREGM